VNDRIKAQHTRQAVVYGITNIANQPPSSPTETHSGNSVQYFDKLEFRNYFPQGQITVYFDKGVSFGAIPMGNDMIAWRLLASQTVTGELADSYIMPIRRAALAQDLKSIALAAHHFHGPIGSAEDIKTPDNDMESDDEEQYENENNDTMQENDQDEKMNLLLSGSESLNGIESRNFALWICEERFPSSILSLIASTDVKFTHTEDNSDLYDEHYLKSFTCANFHPGRVVILGDAAHALATSSIGSFGLTYAINDAILFADQLSNEFRNKNQMNIKMDSQESIEAFILDQASFKFTEKRLAKCLEAITESRYIATWAKTEPRFYHRLIGESVWLRKTFDQMQDQG
jgi:hypothetical protein